MGIKRKICVTCEYAKESKKNGCKFPIDRINHEVMKNQCSGYSHGISLVNQAAQYVMQNYKTFR